MARRIIMGLLIAALAVGCGGHEPQGPRAATAQASPPAPGLVGPPGRLVAIGGGRSLFVHCVGAGSPTVVLEAGLGGDTFNWRDVQPQLGRTARTCAYDRAGFGSSVAVPGVHDARAEIADLQRLLDRGRLAPPYVLVGHSYGGLLARLFTRAHPQQVAGVVLVDAKGRNQIRRTLAIWPPSQAAALRRSVAEPVTDGVDLAASEALDRGVRSLGATPLAVITAGTHEAEWGRVPRRLGRGLDRLWTTMQDELAALSTDHVHVVALRSDHHVQLGQPAVVIRAVQAVVRAGRDRAQLPPCRRLFAGPDVRCRP